MASESILPDLNARPRHFGNALERVRATRLSLRKSEGKVADLVLADPARILESSFAGLASLAGVSQPTVMRFCVAIGFSGYQEFKLRLAQSLALGRSATHSVISDRDDLGAVTDKIFEYTMTSLDWARQHLDQEALERAVDFLAEAASIAFFGFGASAVVAMDAQQKFPLFGVPCRRGGGRPSADHGGVHDAERRRARRDLQYRPHAPDRRGGGDRRTSGGRPDRHRRRAKDRSARSATSAFSWRRSTTRISIRRPRRASPRWCWSIFSPPRSRSGAISGIGSPEAAMKQRLNGFSLRRCEKTAADCRADGPRRTTAKDAANERSPRLRLPSTLSPMVLPRTSSRPIPSGWSSYARDRTGRLLRAVPLPSRVRAQSTRLRPSSGVVLISSSASCRRAA